MPNRSKNSSAAGAAARRGAAAERTRKPSKRDKEVLEAALKVFYDRGYADATVQDVADELGILKGSLYHYIATKEDLLYRLFEEVHEETNKILEQVEAEPDLDPLERLELYIRRQVEYNLNNLKRISIYYHDMDLLGPERLEVVQGYRREHTRYVTKLIRQAQEQGLADASCDARLLANCVFATIIWTYRWYRSDGGASRATVVRVCQQFAARGAGVLQRQAT